MLEVTEVTEEKIRQFALEIAEDFFTGPCPGADPCEVAEEGLPTREVEEWLSFSWSWFIWWWDGEGALDELQAKEIEKHLLAICPSFYDIITEVLEEEAGYYCRKLKEEV